jgi:hypothetical protein
MMPDAKQELPLDPGFVGEMLNTLAATAPAGEADPDAAGAARREAARIAFEALHPADAAQAMLAAEIIAIHRAVMDCLRRAMLPDIELASMLRLHAAAASLGRMLNAARRALAASQAPPKPARAMAEAKATTAAARTGPKPPRAPSQTLPVQRAEPAAASIPVAAPEPLLLDAAGKLIPLHRWEDMTTEQHRLAYGYPTELAAAQMAARQEEIGRGPAGDGAGRGGPDDP